MDESNMDSVIGHPSIGALADGNILIMKGDFFLGVCFSLISSC